MQGPVKSHINYFLVLILVSYITSCLLHVWIFIKEGAHLNIWACMDTTCLTLELFVILWFNRNAQEFFDDLSSQQSQKQSYFRDWTLDIENYLWWGTRTKIWRTFLWRVTPQTQLPAVSKMRESPTRLMMFHLGTCVSSLDFSISWQWLEELFPSPSYSAQLYACSMILSF